MLLPFAPALADNPVVTHRALADPNAFLFGDRLYAICSNDDDNVSGYDMKSAVVVSTTDLVNWTDHGDVFRTTRDAKWAGGSYAPTAITAKDKVYMYFPNTGSGVGVLIADRPEGPYKDPLGKALISGGALCPMAWCFDPVIFVDDDAAKSAFLIWGGGTPYGSNFRGSALNADMISLKGALTTPNTPNSFEGPFVHKYKGNYYMHYPIQGNSNLEYGMSSTSPISGYTRKGLLLANPSLNGANINMGNNSHASIIQYGGGWYLMYHDRRLYKSTYKRNISIDKLEYNADGTIKPVVVTTGVPQISDFDPYDSIPAATMSAQQSIKASFNPSLWKNLLVPQSSGAWIRISKANFGSGAKEFQVNAATAASNITLEIRSGSPTGTVSGSCTITPTGSTSSFATTNCPLTDLTGTKDLYLKFNGTTANAHFAWYRFVPLNPVSLQPQKPERITSSAPVRYSIYDLQGHLVARTIAAADVPRSTALESATRALPNGTYCVRAISTEGATSSMHVVAFPR